MQFKKYGLLWVCHQGCQAAMGSGGVLSCAGHGSRHRLHHPDVQVQALLH